MLSKFTQKQYETKSGKHTSSLKQQKTPAATPKPLQFVPADPSTTTASPSTSKAVNNTDEKVAPVQSTQPITADLSTSLSSFDLREYRSHLQSLRFSVINDRLPVPEILTSVPDSAFHSQPAIRHPHIDFSPLIDFIDAVPASLLDQALRLVSNPPTYQGFASTQMSRLSFDHVAFVAAVDLVLEKIALVVRF
jgi:hypothetical protein